MIFALNRAGLAYYLFIIYLLFAEWEEPSDDQPTSGNRMPTVQQPPRVVENLAGNCGYHEIERLHPGNT